jgi:hypothetical protein
VTPIASLPATGNCYLEMQVNPDRPMTPRVRITSSAYSYFAQRAESAGVAIGQPWVRGGPGDSVLYTAYMVGLAKGGGANALLGPSAWTHVNLGFRCTTGLSGQDRFHCAVGGGRNNVASGLSSTVAGGDGNRASGDEANVAGGDGNSATAFASSIGGGWYNRASGSSSFVGGGGWGDAMGDYSVIGGGRSDSARALYGAALSGFGNLAGAAPSDTGALVAGGSFNWAFGRYGFVGGGRGNQAYEYAAIGGGESNYAARAAAVGGGLKNAASAAFSTVAGGMCDTSAATYSFTAGTGSVVPYGYTNSAAFNGQTATASNQTRVGILSKASGTFTIDHPLDLSGKILNHYFIEGPEMRNIYDGEAVLDASGRAVVFLPDYFDALNRKPRVQLTGVGSSDVYVTEKVSGNRFTIGGKPGAQVYWQVTGERKDVSAEVTRRMMPVEQPKTDALAGRMLDDEFLAGCMDQLMREGKATGIDFRTAAGRQRYEHLQKMLREAEQQRSEEEK